MYCFSLASHSPSKLRGNILAALIDQAVAALARLARAAHTDDESAVIADCSYLFQMSLLVSPSAMVRGPAVVCVVGIFVWMFFFCVCNV